MNGHTLLSRADLTRFRFTGPARKADDQGYLYIVAFDSGLTKVGYTARPQDRITDHISAAAIHGVTPAAAWISKPHANARSNESDLLSRCHNSATARIASEYFAGLNFADAVDHALSLTFHDSHEEHLRTFSVRSAEDAALLAARRPRATDERRWAKKIRDGRARVMNSDDFDKFIERVERAEETNRLLADLLGVQRMTSSHLPRVLRRAADRLEQTRKTADGLHGFLVDDWDRLLPGGLKDDAEAEPFDALNRLGMPATDG